MWMLDRTLGRRLAPERQPPHAPGVEAGDQRGGEADRPEDVDHVVVGLGEREAEDLLLGKEAHERDHPHQRQRADEEGDRRRPHLIPKAAVPAHVLLVVHRVNDVPGCHEEEGLEKRVGQKVEEAGGVRADAHGEEHVADLAHRGVGQHALDVDLDDGDRGREERGDGADDRDRGVGVSGDVVDGVHSPDEVDAGGDHRGRMDQGADRRGALHSVRQPGVQRELGRLCYCSDQQKEGG